MSTEESESGILIAFARAASKAQEIEALFRDSMIAVEVAADIAVAVAPEAPGRSFEDIEKKIDRLSHFSSLIAASLLPFK